MGNFVINRKENNPENLISNHIIPHHPPFLEYTTYDSEERYWEAFYCGRLVRS